jgi:hypothetical protein
VATILVLRVDLGIATPLRLSSLGDEGAAWRAGNYAKSLAEEISNVKRGLLRKGRKGNIKKLRRLPPMSVRKEIPDESVASRFSSHGRGEKRGAAV